MTAAEAEVPDETRDRIVSAAEASAEAVGNHLNHVVDHLMSIGCISRAAVESYFRLERRTLASLYFEARRAHPSPSELKRLALRYALDARRSIEGDVGRFVIRPSEGAWEVVEYPSVAMRVPAIPCPGCVIQHAFAERILDCLQQFPPDIYRLMELIESLLGGVPTQADCLGGGGGADATESLPQMEVDLERSIVYLHGEACPVTSAQAYFVEAVISAQGAWISGSEMRESAEYEAMIGPRPDRVRARPSRSITAWRRKGSSAPIASCRSIRHRASGYPAIPTQLGAMASGYATRWSPG